MSTEAILATVLPVLVSNYDLDVDAVQADIFTNSNDVEVGVLIYDLALDFHHVRFFFHLPGGMGMVIFGYADTNVDILTDEWLAFTRTLTYLLP